VITKFELLFNTVIRQNIFEGSIQIYMDFLRKYVVPEESSRIIYKISSSPLIVLQLNVNPIKQKAKKKSKREHKEVKEQQIEEEMEEIIFYEPNLDTIEDTLTIPFDILHRFSMNFNKLEKDLLPLLNMEAVPSFPVAKEDPILANPTNEVIAIIRESFKKPQQILEDFKAFSYIMEKPANSVAKKLFPPDAKGNKTSHHVMYLNR
jgi:dynein heavy chain